MQRTADFHAWVADARLAEAAGIVDHTAALDAAVDVLDAHAATHDASLGGFLAARERSASGLAGRHDDLDLVEREGLEAQILEQLTARRSGIRGASAIRLSWVRPSEGSLRKRMVSTALISRTFLTVWHLFLPRSSRVCSVGSWGRPMRRSVPSCPTGGRPGPVPMPVRAQRTGSAAPAPAPPWRSRPPRSPRDASPALAQTRWEHLPARVASPATPPRGHESTDGLCSGPCRIDVPARLGADRASGR